ncbi:MAG: hypothetical protein S4CHLAM45_13150 [Chlamydiales bacterium]|nr:hypothetical protein [Chlamydiales bacterium]MCH9619804.1 hypothetical protein [Chlamydiales bacterium]MCH9623410.1 hypothetical protein [Chlamydiales bacterium]
MRGLLIFLMTSTAFAETITLTTDYEEFIFNVKADQTISEIIDKADFFLGETDQIVLEVSKKHDALKFWDREVASRGQYLGYPRDYLAGVSEHEKNAIHYIVKTLANKNLIAIGLLKSELEVAGDRIDHVHPLHFLRTIFTNDELKVGVRNIRGKGWIWNSFTSGIKESLSTEMEVGNLKEEFIIDFAEAVKIHPDKIYPYVYSRDWDGLIDLLIKEVPREDDGNRYDC